MTRILIGQMASNGDCFYATPIARQLRQDFPDAEITWAISSFCRSVIENNPHIDHIWEIPLAGWHDTGRGWDVMVEEASKRGFDQIHLTQIHYDNYANFDGTIRASIFRNFGYPITVPIDPVVALTASEKERVTDWVARHGIDLFGKVVLFECSSKSGQSFMNPEIAVEIASRVLARLPDTLFIISTIEPVHSDNPQIIAGGELSLRETAELSNYVDLFVGCVSGISVACTSTAAKPQLPMVQIFNPEASVSCSLRYDYRYFGKPADHILETTSLSLRRLADTVTAAIRDGAEEANRVYGEDITPDFLTFCTVLDRLLRRRRMFTEVAGSLLTMMRRFGPEPQLQAFGRALVAPFLPKEERERFLEALKSMAFAR